MKSKITTFIFVLMFFAMPVHSLFSQECVGTSNEVSDAMPLSYGWEFKTTAASEAEITFECLDQKDGLVAYIWDESNGFMEKQMTQIPGTNKFTYTTAALDAGAIIKVRCKFAYAGGMSVTKQLEFTVGNCQEGSGEDDTEKPTAFTARIKVVSYAQATIELSASDNSGAVVYTISRDGANDMTFSALSATPIEKIISGLKPGINYSLNISVKDATGNEAENNPIPLQFTTLAAENTECQGIGFDYEGEPSVKPIFKYHISTTAEMKVQVDIEFLENVVGLVPEVLILWPEGGDAIVGFTPLGENKYTTTIAYNVAGDPFTEGQEVSFKGRFPYAGGLAMTTPFKYTAGSDCVGSGLGSIQQAAQYLYVTPIGQECIELHNSSDIAFVSLYNMNGIALSTKVCEGANNTTINTGSLPNGIYLVIAKNKAGEISYTKFQK